MGFARLTGRMAALADALEGKAHVRAWEAGPASEAFRGLLVLARLARDLES